MSKDNPMSQVTRLTGLAFSEDSPSVLRALYLPRLTQQQVIDIPVTPELVGAIVFNIDTEELETYTAAGFWLPIITSESDLNLDNLVVETIVINESITAAQFVDVDLYSIHSHDITNDTVISTLGLLVYGDAQINDNLVINNDLEVNNNLEVNGTADFVSGGVEENFGVNGILTAGTLLTTGNLGVNGESELHDTTVTGDLTVTGNAIFDDYSGETMDVNDFEGRTVRVDALLYGQTDPGGISPMTATLDAGAGTGATISITGSNTSGIITLTTGSSPATSAVIATFTIPVGLNPFTTGVGAMITKAGNAVTAAYEAATGTYINASSSNVIAFMGSGAVALTASTQYVWNYIFVGNIQGT